MDVSADEMHALGYLGSRSALEDYAQELAKAACEWSYRKSGGRTQRWDDLGVHGKAALTGVVLTHLAIQGAQSMIPMPELP